MAKKKEHPIIGIIRSLDVDDETKAKAIAEVVELERNPPPSFCTIDEYEKDKVAYIDSFVTWKETPSGSDFWEPLSASQLAELKKG